MPDPPIMWHQLSGSAQDAVVELSTTLASGFTGTIELTCAEGGVRAFKVTRTLRSNEMGKSEGSNSSSP